MSKLLGLVAGLAVFALWMSSVGNPHVVETIMGVAIGVIVWFFVTRTLRRLFSPSKTNAPVASKSSEQPPVARVAGFAKCPKCTQRSRVPIGKLIEVTCPSCSQRYEYGP